MLKNKLVSIWNQQILRFGVVGVFNTFFDITLLLFFYKVVGVPEVVANTFSVSIAVSLSYFLNHHIVFRYHKKYSLRNFLRFTVITGLSIMVVQNLVIFVVTHYVWNVSASETVIWHGKTFMLQTVVLLAAKLIAVAVGMVWNFLLYKYVVFPNSKQPDDSEEIIIA